MNRALIIPPHISNSSNVQTCPASFNCRHKGNCRFFHPQINPCRHGNSCNYPGCTFTHPRQIDCWNWNSCRNAVCEYRHPKNIYCRDNDRCWNLRNRKGCEFRHRHLGQVATPCYVPPAQAPAPTPFHQAPAIHVVPHSVITIPVGSKAVLCSLGNEIVKVGLCCRGIPCHHRKNGVCTFAHVTGHSNVEYYCLKNRRVIFPTIVGFI